MSKLLLLPLVLAAALAAVAAAPAAESGSVTAFGAALAAGGEKPAAKGVPAGASGIFSAVVTKNGSASTIAWTLRVSRLSGKAAAAHIHFGAPGVAGPVALPLCGPCSSGASGRAPLSAKLADALASGGAYVNVHTARNPGGEIRGEVGLSHAFAAGLLADNETPKPTAPAGAKGSFTAMIVDAGKRPVLTWTLGFGGLSGPATAAHVHLGKPGAAGQVVLPLCGPCGSGGSGRKEIDPGLARAIESGGAYVNVHTQANVAGEIRGQLEPATQGVATLSTGLGTILVDDRGRTLYMFEKDQGGKSACYGQCAVFWPPALAIGPAVATGGADSSLLRVVRRDDGSSMLTYNGFPLYGFLPDTAPGDTKGEGSRGFGAPWWVLAADGSKITK